MARYPVMPHFPPPEIDNNRPRLYPNKADFIAGDPHGLYELAGMMYAHVSSHSTNTVDTLVKTVTGLVKDDNQPGGYTAGPGDGWIGATAKTFRDSFVSDAAMMNGLNRVMCRVAKVVDYLASGLSGLEYQLETSLERIVGRREPSFNINWLSATGSGTAENRGLIFTSLARPIMADSSRAIQIRDLCNQIAIPVFAEADKRRYTAASQLAAVGKILEEAFSYYSSYSAGPGSPATTDPSVLLTSGQSSSNAPGIKQLQDEYSQLGGKLNEGSLDENAVKSTLNALGIATKNSGTILNDIKDLKAATGTIGTGGRFLSLVGDALPVLMMIGMAAA